MKKRLLLILAVGIAFAPAVFADGGTIGAFTRTDAAGQSFCQAGITRTKDDDGSSTVANSGQGSGTQPTTAGAISD